MSQAFEQPPSCQGADGTVREFHLRLAIDEIDATKWWATVYDDYSQVGIFSFHSHSVGYRVHNQDVSLRNRKQGIPEATILAVFGLLDSPLVSSTNADQREDDERRNGAADKVWQRLVDAGLATYDEQSDRYLLSGRHHG